MTEQLYHRPRGKGSDICKIAHTKMWSERNGICEIVECTMTEIMSRLTEIMSRFPSGKRDSAGRLGRFVGRLSGPNIVQPHPDAYVP